MKIIKFLLYLFLYVVYGIVILFSLGLYSRISANGTSASIAVFFYIGIMLGWLFKDWNLWLTDLIEKNLKEKT